MKKLIAVLSILLLSIIFVFLLSRVRYLFIVGLNPLLGLAFVFIILLVAVPSIIKSINWLGKRFGDKVFTPARLFAAGFICWLISAFIAGIFLGSSSLDIHFHDTYFVIAHTHVAIGMAACFGIFCVIYYGFPIVFGRYLNTAMAYIHFWITFLGAYLIFWPVHYEGLAGMPRRYFDYSDSKTFDTLTTFSQFMTIISLSALTAQVIFLVNILYSIINGRKATVSGTT